MTVNGRLIMTYMHSAYHKNPLGAVYAAIRYAAAKRCRESRHNSDADIRRLLLKDERLSLIHIFGAALLGAGGGGDPYVGKLVAVGAVKECGPVTLLEPEEVPDDALVIPIAMMGAPTVVGEKGIGGK